MTTGAYPISRASAGLGVERHAPGLRSGPTVPRMSGEPARRRTGVRRLLDDIARQITLPSFAFKARLKTVSVSLVLPMV